MGLRRVVHSKLLNDAIRFFNGTPVHTLPPPRSFKGAGVYAIYCTAPAPIGGTGATSKTERAAPVAGRPVARRAPAGR